jgi:hypothetical protein
MPRGVKDSIEVVSTTQKPIDSDDAFVDAATENVSALIEDTQTNSMDTDNDYDIGGCDGMCDSDGVESTQPISLSQYVDEQLNEKKRKRIEAESSIQLPPKKRGRPHKNIKDEVGQTTLYSIRKKVTTIVDRNAENMLQEINKEVDTSGTVEITFRDTTEKIDIRRQYEITADNEITSTDLPKNDPVSIKPLDDEESYELKETLGLTDERYQILKNKFKHLVASKDKVKKVQEAKKEELNNSLFAVLNTDQDDTETGEIGKIYNVINISQLNLSTIN